MARATETGNRQRRQLAIRSIEGKLGLEHADNSHSDLHQALRPENLSSTAPFNRKTAL